jgi:hypothetical protein
MKRAAFLVAMLAMGSVGCDDDSGGMMHPDLSVKMGKDANMGNPIGSPCHSIADCTNGTNPQCKRALGDATGVCSADCTSDADCGAGNGCLGAPQKAGDPVGQCTKTCMADTDCASTDTLCWISLSQTFNACWPKDSVFEYGKKVPLNCDATVAGCTFAGSPIPGACERQILGSGMNGTCRQGCDIGVGTCPNAPDGTPQNCYFVDESIDANNMPNGDALKQPMCVVDVAVGSPAAFIADGTDCTDPADGNHYYDICQPGSQCETYNLMSGGMADNLCHKLCYLSGGAAPDMGPLFEDGGIAMGCPGGQTCTDVFNAAGASSAANKVGLCQ